MSTTEASSEIPKWIKNNAGWWADEQIDDASFLKGIEYLVDNLYFYKNHSQVSCLTTQLMELFLLLYY